MSVPIFSADDYAGALLALLPPGPAFPRDRDTVLAKVVAGLAAPNHDSNVAADDLLVQAFPSTVGDLLPEWEQTLGLEAGVLSEAARRAAVVDALTNVGSISEAFYVELAASLGYSITVERFDVHDADQDVDTPINSDEWAHTWRVHAPAASASTYTLTADVVHEVADFGIPALDEALGTHKPAHTICIMRYT